MSREHYSFWFRLDNRDGYLIFFYDEPDPDGFVTDERGKVSCFLNTEDLLHYASVSNLTVDAEDPRLLDIDILVTWLESKDATAVDCKTLLEAWNLFDDFSKTVDGNFDADQKKTQKIYNKLFWGNNLPAVTPEGEQFEPVWTKRELKIMREVLGVGLSLFKEKTSCV